MDDDFEFLCKYEGHDEDEILGFCLNNTCKENPQFCLKCCWDKHSSHEEECKTFRQIQKTILNNKKLEEEQHTQLINKIQEIQKLCEQINQQKNMDSGTTQSLEKDLKDREYKKCLDHIPLFKKYCLYLQSNAQKTLLEQLEKGLSTLKFFTLGISEIFEQTKILENINTSIKSEIINPNQNDKKVEILKKDQEVQVNIEVLEQNQNVKQKQNEIEIVEKKEIVKPVITRIGLPPQQPNQQSSGSSYQQPKPQNPPSVSNSSSNIYPPPGSNPQKQYPPSNPINKPYQPPPGSSSINQQPYSQQPPQGKIPPPIAKSQQLPVSNPQPYQQKAQNPSSQYPKAQPPPGSQSQLQKYQQQKSESGSQEVDPLQIMNLLGSSGNEQMLKKVIELSLQQQVNQNAKENNQPAPKIQIDNELVKYYQHEIGLGMLQKQCAELLQTEKYKEALDLINKQNANVTESSFEILLIKWKCLFKLNKFEEALETCNNIIEEHQDQTQILALKGLTLHQLNRYEEAIEFFELATNLNPNDFNGFFNQGQTMLALKKYEEAIKCFERSIEINPESEHSYFLLGNALKKLDKFNQAVDNYNITININPKHQVALTFKAQCLIELKIYEEAIKTADAALLINVHNQLAQYTKGLGLFKLDAFKEALDCLDKAILIDDTMHEAHALKGETLYKMNKFIAAVTSYDLALQISIEPQYMLKKAEALRALEKVEEAEILQNQAQQLIDQQKQPKNKEINELQQI